MCLFRSVARLVSIEFKTSFHPCTVPLAHHLVYDVVFEAEVAGLRALDKTIEVEDDDVGG